MTLSSMFSISDNILITLLGFVFTLPFLPITYKLKSKVLSSNKSTSILVLTLLLYKLVSFILRESYNL